MMATRRTTRATSKAASSRGASPAITEADIPATPSAKRSSRRAGSATPLPAVASRASTAYGTNTTQQPASLKVPEQGEEISNALNSILQPNTLPAVREEDTLSDVGTHGGRAPALRNPRGGRGSRLAASTTPAPDRSFDNESRIFGQAGIESSVISSSELGGIPESPETPIVRQHETRKQERERLEREERVQTMARTPMTRPPPQTLSVADRFTQYASQSLHMALDRLSKFINNLRTVWTLIKTHLGVLTTIMAFTIFVSLVLLASSGSYRWYGPRDFRHNIGQFVPDSVARPWSTFSPDEIKDLQTRMKAAEYGIAYLKKRPDIDHSAISQLKKILPDEILVKKDKNGNLQITQEFWHALDAKMRAENAYLQHEFTHKPSKGSSTPDISMAQVENLMENSKMWDRFLHINRAQINAWAGEEFDARFPKKLEDSINDGVIASKAHFVELLRQNWDDTQQEIRSEIRKIAKQLGGTIHRVGKAEQDAVGYTKEEIKSISTDVFRTLFSTAQLEAQAKANKNLNVAASSHRLNHFSQGTGAVVNPKLTSPNYLFPSMDRNFLIKGLSMVIWKPIPTPNPPEVALQKWEEHGDCWCSPSKDADGFGPSLAVIMSNQIYPDQIIIEHVPRSGSLEPGAAPRDMELLAYIEDQETYYTIKQQSDDIFQEEALVEEPQPFGFVRIATWTYDSYALSNIQSFPLQIDLSAVEGPSHTNRLIVRSKNNWGGNTVGFTCLYRVRVNGEIVPKD